MLGVFLDMFGKTFLSNASIVFTHWSMHKEMIESRDMNEINEASIS